jgi:hypothetical protein
MKTKNYAWGMGQRKTVQQMFRWGTVREPYPAHADSLEFLRYDRMIWRVGRKPNRITVGTIRAMGATNFFRGCHLGAENE